MKKYVSESVCVKMMIAMNEILMTVTMMVVEMLMMKMMMVMAMVMMKGGLVVGTEGAPHLALIWSLMIFPHKS